MHLMKVEINYASFWNDLQFEIERVCPRLGSWLVLGRLPETRTRDEENLKWSEVRSWQSTRRPVFALAQPSRADRWFRSNPEPKTKQDDDDDDDAPSGVHCCFTPWPRQGSPSRPVHTRRARQVCYLVGGAGSTGSLRCSAS